MTPNMHIVSNKKALSTRTKAHIQVDTFPSLDITPEHAMASLNRTTLGKKTGWFVTLV